MHIGKLIHAYRKDQKLSLRTLAREIGIEHNALFRFEAGRELKDAQWIKIMIWMLTDEPNNNNQRKSK